jgi:hypothetical protein
MSRRSSYQLLLRGLGVETANLAEGHAVTTVALLIHMREV